MREYSRIALTLAEAVGATGLSRKTLDAAVRSGCLRAIHTGADGTRQLLLVSDLNDLLSFSRDNALILNDDLANMARVKVTREAMMKTSLSRRA